MKRLLCLILCALTVFSFTACSDGKTEKDIFAMDTYMRLTVYEKNSDEALEMAAKRITEIDSNFSVSSVTGEIETLIRTGRLASPSPELLEMLGCAKALWERTGGAYDVTAYALSELWRRCEDEGRAPTEAEVAAARSAVGMDRITFNENEVALNGVAGIDLGSIAKGYAGTEAARVLREYGVKGGVLTLGGNVVTLGEKPDGSDFRIGITDPADPSEVLGYLTVGETSVVTSGKYNRFFTVGDAVYHHIIDVITGYPCENGVASVTVVCEDGMWADALSTSMFLLGRDKALEYHSLYGGFEMVIVTDDGAVTVTDGLKAAFSSAE